MKKNSKKAIIGFIIIVIILSVYNHFTSKYNMNKFIETYNYFDSTHIEGVIEKLGTRNHGESIKIKGIKKQFIFYPNYLYYQKPLFRHLVEVGDSLYKPSNSRKIKLIKKNNKEFIYSFKDLDTILEESR
jgi:hypothetical protein